MTKKRKGNRTEQADVAGFSLQKLREAASPAALDSARSLVNSPRMIKRVRDGSEVTASFVTPIGRMVHTTVHGKKYSLQGICTCETEYFCRHQAAVALTWMDYPKSFLDLERFLDDLSSRPKEELVLMLRRMIARYPASGLEVLGLPGFLPAEILEADDEDMGELLSGLEALDELVDAESPLDGEPEDWDEELDYDDEPDSGNNTPLN